MIITYDNNPTSRAAKEREKLMLPALRQAREFGQVSIPHVILDLVSDRLISMRAYQLYSIFLKLVDTKSLQVSVPRKELAGVLGMQHGASVDRYIRELEMVGLLHVEYQFDSHGSGHKANLYTAGLVPCAQRVWAA